MPFMYSTCVSSLCRPQKEDEGGPIQAPSKLRPLYDIPYMFEAREFLRKKLIGKKVGRNVVVNLHFICLGWFCRSTMPFNFSPICKMFHMDCVEGVCVIIHLEKQLPYKNAAYILRILLGIFYTQFARMKLII